MNETVFIVFIIFLVTGLIYFMYKILLNTDKNGSGAELQISNQDLLAQIKILQKQRKYSIVENLAKSYLEKKPGADDVRIALAKSLHSAKKFFEAVDQAKIVLKHKPSNRDVLIFLANCYMDIEKPIRAIDILEDILDKDPTDVVAIKQLAEVYYTTNQKKSAIKMYSKLEPFIDSNQEKVNNKLRVAQIYIDFNEFDYAAREYEEVLEIYPEDAETKKSLIELYKKSSDYITAINLATEMLENGDSIDVLWALEMLRDIYTLISDFAKALEYAYMVKNHPLSNKNRASECIAEIFLKEGEVDASIDLLKELSYDEANNIEIKKSLARCYEINRDFEAATDLYKKILDLASSKDIKQIHYELSNIYSNWAMYEFAKSDNNECFKYFVTALKYYDQNPDMYYRLGIVNKLVKNYNEAISNLKRAIELDSENADYLFEISECYEEIDSIYEQKKYLQECLSYDPDNAKAHFKLGLIYEIQGNHTSAIENIRSAIEIDENLMEAKYKLALILEHVGRVEEAIEFYEEILKSNPENEEVANNLRMLKQN